MSVQALVEKITHDAEERAAQIRADAQTKATAIEAETEQMRSERVERAATALEKEKAHRTAVRTSLAKQAGNQLVQQAKRTALDAAFDAAFEAVRNESSEAYVLRFTALAQSYNIDPATVRTIATAPERSDEMREIATALNLDPELIEADPTIRSGFTIDAGARAYDCSLDRLFAGRRADLEITVAQTLFASS